MLQSDIYISKFENYTLYRFKHNLKCLILDLTVFTWAKQFITCIAFLCHPSLMLTIQDAEKIVTNTWKENQSLLIHSLTQKCHINYAKICHWFDYGKLQNEPIKLDQLIDLYLNLFFCCFPLQLSLWIWMMLITQY